MDNYVITIARGFGTGGKEIGEKLGKELKIPCYDRQLLTMASDKSGIDEQLFVESNEKLKGKYISNFLRKLPYTHVLEPSEKDFVSDINLFNIQAELIRSLARSESCIIIGKCADDILQEYPNVISVYVDAPMDYCVNSIMNKMYVSEDRAKNIVYRTNKYRAQYYNYYTGGKVWDDSKNYDLVLNSARIGRDNCVTLIKEYMKIKVNSKKIYMI